MVNLYIVNNKTVLWFLGVLAPVIALGKNIVSRNIQDQPNDVMKQISNYVSIDQEFIENANLNYIKKQFFTIYEYKIYTLFKDIFYTIISPFELWTLSYEHIILWTLSFKILKHTTNLCLYVNKQISIIYQNL